MTQETYQYHLYDDGGVCTIELPIILKIGTFFEHEFGTYKVTEHDTDHGSIQIACDRYYTETPMLKVLKARI